MDSKLETGNQTTFDSKMHEMHSSALGFQVPKDYFSKSKSEIFEKVSKQKRVRFNIFSRERIIWSVAATIAIILALTVFRPNALPAIDEIPAIVSDTIDQLKTNGLAQNELEENDILITSLFVPDSEIDEFVDDFLLEELVYEEVMAN
jgi:hypothetical protein